MDEDRKEEAAEVLVELIHRNPEKWSYYAQLEMCLGVGEELCLQIVLV